MGNGNVCYTHLDKQDRLSEIIYVNDNNTEF